MFPVHIKIKFRTWNRRRFKMIVGRAMRARETRRGTERWVRGGTMRTSPQERREFLVLAVLAILDACCHWCFVVHSSVFSLVMEFINISLCAKWVRRGAEGRQGDEGVTRRVNDKWICACGHKECQQLPKAAHPPPLFLAPRSSQLSTKFNMAQWIETEISLYSFSLNCPNQLESQAIEF